MAEKVGALLGRGAVLQRRLPERPAAERRAVNVVWFKRDLRVADHAPLTAACAEGRVLCLFVYEPEWFASAEFDTSHLVFVNEALAELDAALRERGGCLVTRTGRVPDVLEDLWRAGNVRSLFSHEETGNALTYSRDRAVAAWCRARGVPWREWRQDGVVRRLTSRDGWARRWEDSMSRPVLEAPGQIHPVLASSSGLVSPEAFGLPPSTKPGAQKGGMATAQTTLASFLETRGVNYRSDMSSPVEGWEGCSRLSPYLAWGCVSMRSVSQAAAMRSAEVRLLRREGLPVDPRWAGSLRSFEARLRWHCHFMQKLEDEPRIEFENMARACDGIREDFTASEEGRTRLAAWMEGRTGYPLVDACLRCVQATGWLNFRMRAMVMSFASYHLWLHWRPTAVWLARHFLDFEPGIHFSQCQMQSGTTGINTVRIYSPAKQVRDQDPEGVFIRRWVPELAHVPAEWLPEPHRMPIDFQHKARCLIGEDYPEPVVDHATALREARSRMATLRARPASREEARRVFIRHGSRKKRAPKPAQQLPLFAG